MSTFRKNQGRVRGQPFITKQTVFSPPDPGPASSPGQEHRAQGRVASRPCGQLRPQTSPGVRSGSSCLTYHTEPRRKGQGLTTGLEERRSRNRREPLPAFPSGLPSEKRRHRSQQASPLNKGPGGSASLKPGERSCERPAEATAGNAVSALKDAETWQRRTLLKSTPRSLRSQSRKYSLCPTSRPELCLLTLSRVVTYTWASYTPRPSHRRVYRPFL